MQRKFIIIQQVGKTFYAHKAERHFAIHGGNKTAGCCQPGDYVVMDEFFNIYVFDRKLFRKAFGHKNMERLDD